MEEVQRIKKKHGTAWNCNVTKCKERGNDDGPEAA